ncbi:actin-binding Rho-activating protein-like [Polypterus senegalus]
MEKEDNTEGEDSRMSADFGTVEELKQSWQKWVNDRAAYQEHNPFSNNRAMTVQFKKEEEGYGKPREGSETERRGMEAHTHVGKEVEELCQIIASIGETGEDGKIKVTFGKLFEKYVTISNKLVGVLMRARKHGRIAFEGEMLWQRRDDHVVITLLQ